MKIMYEAPREDLFPRLDKAIKMARKNSGKIVRLKIAGTNYFIVAGDDEQPGSDIGLLHSRGDDVVVDCSVKSSYADNVIVNIFYTIIAEGPEWTRRSV